MSSSESVAPASVGLESVSREFAGLFAVVTGGACGIGLATDAEWHRVWDVNPWVRRLLAAADPGAELAALRARQPTGRLVTADEVAAAIAYLASPLAGATTGTVLAVDGGMHGLRLPAPPK